MKVNAAELLKFLQAPNSGTVSVTERYSCVLTSNEMLVKALLGAENEVEQLKAQLTTTQKQLQEANTQLAQLVASANQATVQTETEKHGI